MSGPKIYRLCAHCCRDEHLKQPEDHCPGWLHMDDCGGHGPGIERCDECSIFGVDEDAIAVHAMNCDCGAGSCYDPRWSRASLTSPNWPWTPSRDIEPFGEFDIAPELVAWCAKHIEELRRYPQGWWVVIDLRSGNGEVIEAKCSAWDFDQSAPYMRDEHVYLIDIEYWLVAKAAGYLEVP